MKKYYFLVVSVIMLILSIVGFSDNLITDVHQKSNSDPKFIIHGLFCFAWFIIVVIQTNFVKNGNSKAHMKLGIAGLAAAIGVFITTLYIFIVVYKGWESMMPLVRANRLLMLGFAIFIAMAYLKRKKTDQHKRLIIVASFYMLQPILDRAMGRSFLNSIIKTDLAWDMTFYSIWGSFFISLFIFDWIVLKKIHTVTYVGVFMFVVVLAISFLT
ncbi:MAG: hypothetical protein IPP71_18815 [Bacteroidetes bacterium]|nr:hypothetical protein [Bacteroidota bacterium]